ncbi:hypothetical protein G7B40_019830 [Aetokthonos hydrillicola Thurmond2011]|uniref:VWFA domain-containing protein n=1 Tax=Aetokthonos hydrillicola Thurmond2011 TaxID=2712845 RepID=A0AAP5I8A2_9CYAN|nr:hypothetical protein [Aetokthonos hydrillicola]MBO3460455.1 hypothetical protein [Aetokthonos hydrillicola CCALA 1050]MBW4588468.1 hypothetical protein [Aetokthonos hydrillicola CCALA 1050]MDR9896797.1 hypothetical protein [Aetokthonos hydrillicola Thurmond2011]
MTKQANSAIAVDLVILIDTSPSMKDQAQGLSNAAASAITKAKSSCPSDLRVVWLGIEGIWKGTNFDQTIRAYLTQKVKVSESKLRGRKKGELKSAGAQEDGARAIEDISEYFDWRKDAARAIFYLGDEALEGGGDKTERDDIRAADLAIQKAQKAGVTIHTYFGTSKSKYQEGIKSEYARVATSTGGQFFTDKDTLNGFSALLEKVICGSRTVTTTKLQPGAVYIHDCISNELSKLYTLDLVTGKASFIGEIVTEVFDIAFVGSQLYGLDREGDKTQLVKIDLNTGDAVTIGNTGFAASGLAYNRQRQTLYATTAKQLIAINLETGKGNLAITVADKDYNCGEVAFDGDGKAYITLIGYDKKKLLATANLDTGEVKIIGDIGFASVASIEFVGNVLYGVTGNFFNLGKDGQLIRIDTTTGKGTLVTVTDPIGRWAGMSIYNPITTILTEIPPEEKPEEPKVPQNTQVTKEIIMNTLTIDTKNNCYVIDANQMNNLQQNVATSFIFEKGTFDIRISSGRYSNNKTKKLGEPFVLLWIYGDGGTTFINRSTGFEVGATWTTLNGYNDTLKLETKERAVLNALFFDFNNEDSGGSIDILITSSKQFFNPVTLKVDSKRNCYVLDENHFSSLKQSGSNFVELNPGNYRIKIREGNASYWSDNKKFNIEPWALILVRGGRFIAKLTDVETDETWVSLNGLKDEVVLQIKEKTTLTGLFFDTHKEDNEGQVILAIDQISDAEIEQKRQQSINSISTVVGSSTVVEGSTVVESSTVVGGSTSVSRERREEYTFDLRFRFEEEEFKKKWEEQIKQIESSTKAQDKVDVTLETKYWNQLEQLLLKSYEQHFKSLSMEIAKVKFSMDAYLQQVELSLEQNLQGWSDYYLERILSDKINVEISNKINQQLSLYFNQTFERQIQNNIGLIINNIINKQELSQYVNQQVSNSFEQNVRNHISLIISNIVNKQELNQYVSEQITNSFEQNISNHVGLIISNIVNKQELNQHISQQITNSFEQNIHNHVGAIISNIVNKQELNQYVSQQVTNSFEQNIRNNINLIAQSIVNQNTELNQYLNQHFEENIHNNINLITSSIINNNTALNQYVSQQISNSFEQNIRNHINQITNSLIHESTELNQYFDQRVQLAFHNNTEVNQNIVNIVTNSTEINQRVENILRQKFVEVLAQYIDEFIGVIGGREGFINLITQTIVNNNAQVNQYFEQRVEITVNNNTELSQNIIDIVNNSTEISQKIESVLNETLITVLEQQINQFISFLGGKEAFINLITQSIVNNNPQINQYVTQQINNSFEQNIRNSIQVITQNLINNNTELNQYFDQRLQHNAINNNVFINQIIENNQLSQKIQSVVVNSPEIKNSLLNFVVNSTEISNRIGNLYTEINNKYTDLNIKIENFRSEWNQSFITLVRQYVDELIVILGNRESFNIQIANIINVKVDELLNQIWRIKNELTTFINNSDRNLYEWTLGELMALKGCLTDRQALVEQLVTFSSELRVKLDNTECVDINTFKPFKPLSAPQQLPGNRPQQLPGNK